MKKLFFLVLVIACMTSCNNEQSYYAVTVVAKEYGSIFEKATSLNTVYKVVTISGDTVLARVPENIQLSTKLPYKARMYKADGVKYGYIQAVLTITD